MAKVVLINAKEQKVEVVNASNLEALQALVGGYIEPVSYIKDLGASRLCVDEEGLMKGYAYGFKLDGHTFVGNGFIGTLGSRNTSVSPGGLVGRLEWLVKQA